jgi:NhaP-type Na+/H+ or K+/H+ antiporter
MTEEKLELVSKEEDWEDAKYTFFVIVGAFAFGVVVGIMAYWFIQHIQFSWR